MVEVLHSIHQSGILIMAMRQRTDIFEEASLGSGKGDAAHPSLVVALVN
jgi:hypothetical protein